MKLLVNFYVVIEVLAWFGLVPHMYNVAHVDARVVVASIGSG